MNTDNYKEEANISEEMLAMADKAIEYADRRFAIEYENQREEGIETVVDKAISDAYIEDGEIDNEIPY